LKKKKQKTGGRRDGVATSDFKKWEQKGRKDGRGKAFRAQEVDWVIQVVQGLEISRECRRQA